MFSGVVEAVPLEGSVLQAHDYLKMSSAISPHLSLSSTMQMQQKPPIPAARMCVHAVCTPRVGP